MSVERGIVIIAAALIDEPGGRLLLVRKAGTTMFMQPGGKLEPKESPVAALRRELIEEIGLDLGSVERTYLGIYSAAAANEAGLIVKAHLFHVPVSRAFKARPAAEIEEAAWIDAHDSVRLALAPLTRDHVVPLAIELGRNTRPPRWRDDES